MVRRVFYGTLTITIVLAVVMADVAVAKRFGDLVGPVGELLRRGSSIPIVVVVLFLFSAVEMNRLLRLKGVRPHTVFAYLMVAMLLLAPWLSAAGWLGQGAAAVEGIYWQVVCLIIAVIGVGVLTVIRSDPDGALRDMSATVMMIVFLGFLGSFGVQLRCARDTLHQDGAWLLLIVVLITKASDIGAYFVGSTFGRHKLLPSVSPAKSVEGVFGGIAASAGVAMLIASASSLVATNGYVADSEHVGSSAAVLLDEITRSFSRAGLSSPLRALIFGVSMSVAGQFGDLFESCFKRDAGVKDSGNVIPHFGGILDLMDSLVPALPVAWFLLTAVWGVI